MEFTINCPIDGEIEVELEDIRTVVIRKPERADITFACPSCGTEITVAAVVPAFLLSAIEALANDVVEDGREMVSPAVEIAETGDAHASGIADETADAYCEYFRRQLAQVEFVEDVLDEIDSKPSHA